MIDWSKPICTKHETPLIGTIQQDCPTSGRKRVLLVSLSTELGGPTIYRYDEKGNARQGAGPSDYDLVNYDHQDGVVRMTVDRRKVVVEGRKAA